MILAMFSAIGAGILTRVQWRHRKEKGLVPTIFAGAGTLLFALLAISNL